MKNLGAISCFAFGFAGLVSASNAAQMDAKQLEETRGVSQALLEEDEMSLKVTDRVSFLGEYGRQVEEVSPNVFLFVDGLFKGTTVAFGLSGLNYDIATLNEQLMREPGVSNQAVLSQELGRLNALAESFEKEQGQSKISNSRYGFCTIWDNSTFPSTPYHTNYTLTVVANAGLYLDRGDGSFNRYYARAQAGSSANWSGYLPWNVSRPVGGVGAYTRNDLTGAIHGGLGWNFSESFSGPAFSHSLYSWASASMSYPCSDYISINTQFVF